MGKKLHQHLYPVIAKKYSAYENIFSQNIFFWTKKFRFYPEKGRGGSVFQGNFTCEYLVGYFNRIHAFFPVFFRDFVPFFPV